MLSSVQMGKHDAPWQSPKSAPFIILQVSCYRGFQQISFLTHSYKMLKMTEELMRMGMVKKMLGKQSYMSESETNNLSAGKLCFCSLVIMKLEVWFLIFNFYFIGGFCVFLQTSQAIRRTKQDSDEETAEMQNTLVLLGSDPTQVTSPVP